MTKWGWNWWNGRQALQTSLDNDPFCNLNPLARRTEALRGIYDFAAEVQPLAEKILPKPWGPNPRIGLLYSWHQARRLWVEPGMRDKTPYYHSALRYSHWNTAIIPSDSALKQNGLDGFDVLIAGGIQIVEPEMPSRLETFVRQGGVLIVGEEAMSQDIYGRPLDTAQRLGIVFGKWLGSKDTTVAISETALTRTISGTIRHLSDLREMEISDGTPFISTTDGTSILTRRKLGRGFIYAISADLAYYPLAKMLSAVLEDAAHQRGALRIPDDWRSAEVSMADGNLAPNVLVSRRSYSDHHAILLLNCDNYQKKVRIKLPGLTGKWNSSEALTHLKISSRDGWYSITLKPNSPAIILLEKTLEQSAKAALPDRLANDTITPTAIGSFSSLDCESVGFVKDFDETATQ